MQALKTYLVYIFFCFILNQGFSQNLHIYLEKKDSSEYFDLGFLEPLDGELVHKNLTTENSESILLNTLEEHLEQTENGNVIFYIHGMMAHTKWNQQMVHNKLNTDLYENENNDVDIIISLVWHGTMDYPQNYVDAYSIGKSYFPFIQKVETLTKTFDADRTINFIMHSMGSRAFQGVYDVYMEKDIRSWKAKNAIFVASDAPEDCFYEKGVFNDIEAFAHNIVVYKNAHDFTLGISKGINEQDRIGLNGIADMSKISASISVIDVSILNDNEGMMKLTGHRYFFESPTVKKDLLRVLNAGSKDIKERNLVQDSVSKRTFTLIK